MGCCQDDDEVTLTELAAVIVGLGVLGFWVWVIVKMIMSYL